MKWDSPWWQWNEEFSQHSVPQKNFLPLSMESVLRPKPQYTHSRDKVYRAATAPLMKDLPIRIWFLKRPSHFDWWPCFIGYGISTNFQCNTLFAYSTQTRGKFFRNKKKYPAFRCGNFVTSCVSLRRAAISRHKAANTLPSTGEWVTR
jgi:hypothetical protein